MPILVTGGAGYIGSHTVRELLKNNNEVIVLDNLEKGHKQAIEGIRLEIGDLRDKDFVNNVFTKNDISCVIHFAGYIEVGESVKEPLKYYHNNVISTLNLLSAMRDTGVRNIVFSSTAAVYGEPESTPITEEQNTKPTNPYGATKLCVENILKYAHRAHNIKYIALRYFNASGADESGEIGEAHQPESHLIPIVLQTILGKREKVMIFGDDYSTSDGTCVRDYIHVNDLADAHILAMNKLSDNCISNVYNLGNGRGFSVKQVIDTVKEVTGSNVEYAITDRRSGDPAILIASSDKAKRELGWHPQRQNLRTIVQTAWNWHKKHPEGYK